MATLLSLMSNPAIVSVVALVLEGILHSVPSEKPMGILHGISSVVHMIGSASTGLADFLDKVIPQNLK